METRIIKLSEVNSIGNIETSCYTTYYIDYAFRGLIFLMSASTTADAVLLVTSNSETASYRPGRVFVIDVLRGTDITYDTTTDNQLKINNASNVRVNGFAMWLASTYSTIPYPIDRGSIT